MKNERKAVRVEVIINDLHGEARVKLWTCRDDGAIFIHTVERDSEIHVDDLKAALRKLTAK